MLKKSLSLMAILAATVSAHAETRISATGTEAELCNVDGIKMLHSGNGYSVESFASRNTTPSIVVSLNGKQCYFDLVEGEGSGFNVKYNGQTYHTKKPQYIPTFFFKPATTTTKYSFRISAAGQFDIDWGDGKVETIDKRDTVDTVYSHTYTSSANTYEISLGGRATAYSTNETTAAISFNDGVCISGSADCTSEYGLSSMRGCLGCVFSTLADKSQPRFYFTFGMNKDLTTSIPTELFSGITGAPVSYMFMNLFYGDNKMKSEIPEDLFAGIKGAPQEYVFNGTFLATGGADGLYGEIPGGLFRGLSGAPAKEMFHNTFSGASGLTGEIPEDLFAGIQGAPAPLMFHSTFYGMYRLTGGIPDKLFAGITTDGPYQDGMFSVTFYNCSKLSGPSAKINGRYLYEIWPSSTGNQQTYTYDTGLSDYDCIPTTWGGPGTKNPGECGE